ncbi:MAG TPA: helix-turn-helix domain-containing protein [Pyrinomonadaceae bacterium]|jgi:DNA-binding HxlR family transcriptional regulator|nr:helix-turn-helix domain-containing protein [Pyrinomonadaceae bacterium]
MRRREGDGCPVSGALQVVGDKWTMLIVRDLARSPRRTTELLSALHPISSRTLVDRLRDMEHDALIERRELGGSPPHVEYVLTGRGRLLLPFLDALRELGKALDCNDCEDRKARLGSFCEACPQAGRAGLSHPRRSQTDDSIVLL